MKPHTTELAANSTVRPHSRTAKVMHWGFIGIFIYALTKQLDEVEELEDFALLQYEMVFATVFLLLLGVRFIYMRFTRPTALPADTPRAVSLAAKCCHIGMYLSLSLIAITGLVIGSLYGSGTKSGAAMEVTLVLHEIAVNSSFILIAIHICAAIYHRRKSDGIWNSMVPVLKVPGKD